jgi:3-oxoacyl-[acyl-carrier-protein] synthase III
LLTSDIAFVAAKKAIENANIDPETLDYIILHTTLKQKGAIKPIYYQV